MSLSLAFFTFLNFWWISLFFAWPFSVEYGEPSTTEYAAAPKTIHWKKMLLRATIIAAAATMILALLIKGGIVPLHEKLANL